MHHHTLSPRRLTGVAALACAAALAPAAALAGTASPAAPAVAAGTPRCATSGLVVWMNTQGDGAAGSVYYTLKFTNLSGHACTLRGYPGVSAVSLTGRQLGSPAGWGSLRATTVRLASGRTATAELQIADTGNYSQCFQRLPQRPGMAGLLPTAAGLRVYPPNQTASTVIPYPLRACAHTGPVWIHAGPVTPGGPPPGI
jgi:Protein of unknown function (DUF4232)